MDDYYLVFVTYDLLPDTYYTLHASWYLLHATCFLTLYTSYLIFDTFYMMLTTYNTYKSFGYLYLDYKWITQNCYLFLKLFSLMFFTKLKIDSKGSKSYKMFEIGSISTKMLKIKLWIESYRKLFKLYQIISSFSKWFQTCFMLLY